jgi:hypothetical protein
MMFMLREKNLKVMMNYIKLILQSEHRIFYIIVWGMSI